MRLPHWGEAGPGRALPEEDATSITVDSGRRAHYGAFYDLAPPDGDLLVVVGNCQAESLRLLLDPGLTRSVRVPPVFELDAPETGLLHRLLRRTALLVSHPVRDDYRGLPLGTAQLRALLPAPARCLVVPVVRWAGLHPWQVVEHPPPGLTLPVVPYHDLRTVRRAVATAAGPGRPVTAADVRAVSELTLAELRRREQQTDLRISDLYDRPGLEHARTINHPGNAVLVPLAARIAAELDLPAPADPGRPLLTEVRTPVEPVVRQAWGLPAADGPATWTVGEESVADARVVAEQLAWYALHPVEAAALWERHREQAALLGLLGPRD